MKLIQFLIIVLFLMSCSNNNTTSTSNNQEEQTDTSPIVEPVEQEKRLVGIATIEAEVFHTINNYDGTYTDKDAGRTELIKIDVYEDGSCRLEGGDPIGGIVRYSKKPGYEFECNRTGGDVYAFNGPIEQ